MDCIEADASDRPVISAVGHVALQVIDLDSALEQATTIMGLRVARAGTEDADLTHGAPRHTLQYRHGDRPALHHVGLEAASRDALTTIRGRLRDYGARIIQDEPYDDCLADGLVFELPGGIPVEVYAGMPADQPDYVPTGVRPLRFGHVNVYVPDPAAALDLLVGVLDFRISDRIRGGAFTRCNADHHGIAVLPGEAQLQHHAWEVAGLAQLGELGDALFAADSALVEGPVRHGIGHNIAAYFEGAAGEAVEYYADMEQIIDDERHVPGEWATDGTAWYSRWTQRLPTDEFRRLGARI
jgi:catechol-2,3-dioxygenase